MKIDLYKYQRKIIKEQRNTIAELVNKNYELEEAIKELMKFLIN